MRGLPIRQPYIDMILDGRKTWEMRKSRCNFREQIALIQSGTQTVVGVADVVDCIGSLSDEERSAAVDRHCVAPAEWSNPKFMDYRFAWVMSNVQRLSMPVPYRHPSGAVIWVNLNDSVAQEISSNLDVSISRSLKPVPLSLPRSESRPKSTSAYCPPAVTPQTVAILTPVLKTDIQVPFANDGSFFHPMLRRPRTSKYTVGEKDNELSFDSFDHALEYLREMPVAKWRRPNDSGNWGIVAAARWGTLPKL
jgi:ASCH domain